MMGLAGLGLCLVFLRATPAQGYGPQPTVIGAEEPIRKIREALRTDDARSRVEAGRKAIREALFSSDQGVSGASGRFLLTLSDQVDLRPYTGVFEEFCRASTSCFWKSENADYLELRFGARENRVEIFERAIRSGGTKLPRGTSLLRWMAVHWAGHRGRLSNHAPVHGACATTWPQPEAPLRTTRPP
jgi:hypothetical protein